MESQLEYDGSDVQNKDEVNPKIVAVQDGDEVPPEYRVNVEVSSYHDIERVSIYLDGDKVAEDESFPYGYNFDFSPAQYGGHKFRVVVEDDDGNEGDYEVNLVVTPWSL